MKRILLSALCAVPVFGFGQTLLYNDGAMIKVQAGATLYVEGGIHNTPTGTIDNDGTIEIRGNFINAGAWEAGQANTLKFSGTGHSEVSPGSAKFYDVVIAKEDGSNVNLALQSGILGNMTIKHLLKFDAPGSSKLNLGIYDLTMDTSALAVDGEDANEFVMTGGVGKMRKVFANNGSYEFTVGFDATTYNPATINKTAGPGEIFSVRALASPTDGNGLTGAPITSEVVNAVWDIRETTVGGNTFDVTLGWSESDELTDFDDLLNAVSRNDGTNGWDGLHADLGPEVGNTRTKTGFTGGGAFSVGGKTLANTLVLNPKIFLQGAYASGQMTDLLRTQSLIPLNEPYGQNPFNQAPFNFSHIGYGGGESVPNSSIFDQTGTNNDIVDWVAIEIRSGTTPATRLATRSALIQRDGDIVDLDGVSNLKFYGLADGTYHVRILHRNHIPVRTEVATALSGTVSNLNFTVNGYAYDNDNMAINRPMKDLGAGVMGMWAGDATGDRIVRATPLASPPFTPSDRTYILTNALGGNPNGQLNAYNRSDLNMDGKVRYTPLASPPFTPSDATYILTVLSGNPNSQLVQHN